MIRRAWSFVVVAALVAPAWGKLEPFKPTTAEVRELYAQANNLGRRVQGQVTQLRLVPNWLGDERFWFEKDLPNQESEFLLVTAATGKSEPLFDHAELAKALSEATGQTVTPRRLGINNVTVDPELRTVRFRSREKGWEWNRSTAKLADANVPAQPGGGGGQGLGRGPGGGGQRVQSDYEARAEDGRVQTRKRGETEWKTVSTQDGFTRVAFSPDGKFLVGIKVIPGDRKEVFTVRTNDRDTTRGILETRRYDQPGDKLDTAEYFMYDLATGRETKVDLPPVVCGGYPWANPPAPRWWKPDGNDHWSFTIQSEIRGYQQYQVIRATPATGEFRVMIDEKEDTFVFTSQLIYHPLQKSDAALWRSERTDWAHLYWIDGKTGAARAITSGKWIVRGIESVDEDKQEIVFRANGREPGDPYHIHYYKVKFDGSGLTRLTDGNGTHSVNWSPGQKFFVASWSRMDQAPIHELRDANGRKISELARADASGVVAAGVKPTEVFTAKGRDGETDIWGLIYRPTHFDPNKSYPVIEAIYAGPHDSHVPKAYSPVNGNHSLAELGFIVVQIDGMGTANRGKKFHDVAWKNLKDAGFPDRIAWMKAAAEKYPQMDLERVGIHGTSAGGQNSAGALLFHPDFYKVAVSSCGCHDNRIDKYWWNEQWMGYPVGPHYSESSNIDNAAKLVGKLMLIIGEVDSNVPPESTFRFADALMRAGKDFELIHLPGTNHTGGGQFGERKRRDFFVKHLLGVEPPDWNQ